VGARLRRVVIDNTPPMPSPPHAATCGPGYQATRAIASSGICRRSQFAPSGSDTGTPSITTWTPVYDPSGEPMKEWIPLPPISCDSVRDSLSRISSRLNAPRPMNSSPVRTNAGLAPGRVNVYGSTRLSG
jgi:hypothetical protein